MPAGSRAEIASASVSALHIPTEQPESDGTADWDATGVLIVELTAAGKTGIGFSYTNQAAALVAKQLIERVVIHRNAFDIPAIHFAMDAQCRNWGRPGLVSTAISAIDRAVDVLQADATRCGGISNFMKIGHLCEVHHVPLSAHTAPSLHATLSCALSAAINVEYFYDHSRIEHMIFDGAVRPQNGNVKPDITRPGLGLELKRADATKFQVSSTLIT